MEITWIGNHDKKQLAGFVPERLLGDETVCICALEEGNLCGVMIAVPVAATVMDLSFLYVAEDYRKHGIARDMLTLLTMTVRMIGVGAIVMSMATGIGDGDDSLYDFAISCGFSKEEESSLLSAPLPDVIRQISSYHKMKPFSGKIEKLSNLSSRKWTMLVREIAKRRDAEALSEDKTAKQLYMIPDEMGHYDGRLSQVAIGEGQIPVAALLIHTDENVISVDYLCNFDQGEPQVLVHMMREACSEATEVYGSADAQTGSFHAYNPIAEKMGRTLLGKHLTRLGQGVYLVKYL